MEERADVLRNMQICRFCLNDNGPFTNIYERDKHDGKHIPLPLQIMACVAIEVFANDGMPQLICRTCRFQTNQAYKFKSTCKKSDDALKLYLATGSLIKPNFNENVACQNVVTVRKRLNIEAPASAKKKQKPTPQPVSVSYASPIRLSKTETTEVENETETILGMGMAEDEESQGAETVEEVDDLEEHDDEGEEEEEEESINPVLKVSQVKTDVFPCSQCERSFPLKQLLDLHKANHERERGFACDECGRKFFTKYDLGKHIQTHSDNKPFNCVVCNKQFSRETLLHRHQKVHVDVPKYLCTQCDRTFLTRVDLDLHTEKHNKKRPFSCRVCNKSFVFKQGLERHELTHTHDKPHKCNYCEASFTSPIKLTRHITSHAGLRPYPCKRCGRTFLLSHHLTRHMRSHYASKSSSGSPVGQHKCDVCSMSFRRKDSLINHSAIHSMVNLKCVICNTAFETAQMVKDHITTHLSGLPFPCDKCDYSFETQDQLEEHEVKHAEMEYEEQIEREVSQEAEKKQQEQEEDDEGEDEDEDQGSADDEEVTEFTITNDAENPEIVRRSKREPKIKNYAQFLKQELGSDVDDMPDEDTSADVVISFNKSSSPEETIKPIVRTEGTKVYARKSFGNRTKVLPNPLSLGSRPEMKIASLDQINQPQISTLENLGLTKQAVKALPNKQYIDMKIGDKMVRVQKLMMTRAEIEAMAKEGKIEMKGNTILLKKSVQPTEKSKQSAAKQVSIENIIGDPKPSAMQRPVLKKTYQKRSVAVPEERNNTATTTNTSVEDGNTSAATETVEEQNIDATENLVEEQEEVTE